MPHRFRVRTEGSVLLTLDDSEEVLRGRIDGAGC